MTALIVCSRFSAWSNTMEAGDSKTSSTMLPITRPVAEVRPSARAFCCARVGAGS